MSLAAMMSLAAALLPMPTILAAARAPASASWRPFQSPMPAWDYWFWTLIPLSIGVAIVYKATKTADPRAILRESGVLSLWIVLGLLGAAGVIAVVVRFA